MKAFLMFFLLLSPAAYACKPAPLPSCEGNAAIPLKPSLAQLKTKVDSFQKLLTESLPPGSYTNSCFNDHFASYYVGGMKGPDTCKPQMERVERTVKGLIDPESPEWIAIKDKKALAALKKRAAEVEKAWEKFQKEHSGD